MSKDEFETLGRPQQQKRSVADQQQQALPPEQQQRRRRATDAPDLEIEPRPESFDTVPTETFNWWLPALLGGSVGVLAMLAIGTRVFSPQQPVATTDPNLSTPTSPATVPEGELLLEQANLLATSGDLSGAVEIASSIPQSSQTYAQARQQITAWQGAIASAQEAELASAQAQAAEARQQQELAQAQAQAAEARRQQELAQEQARVAEARRQQEVAQAQAQIAEAQRQQELARTQAQTAQTEQQREAARAQIQAAEAQAAEAQRQQELAQARAAEAQAQAAEARRQQELAQAQAQAQAAEARRQQELAQAQAAEAQRQQELAQAQAQAAEAQRQQELARAQARQQSLGNPAESPAPTQAQQPATANSAADPFLSVNIPQASVPATAPVQVAAAPTTIPTTPGNSYGFRNVTVQAPTVAIELRDNVDEDGDFVTLRVNGKEYATNTRIWNSGKTIFVPLQLGQNIVEIVGVKDGQGGITLEANVAGVGNVNERPIPEGSTARFIINREQ